MVEEQIGFLTCSPHPLLALICPDEYDLAEQYIMMDQTTKPE